MKMIRHQSPTKNVAVWRNVPLNLVQKEPIVIGGEEYSLFVITTIVDVIK